MAIDEEELNYYKKFGFKGTIFEISPLYESAKTFKEVLSISGLTTVEFSELFGVPDIIVQFWKRGTIEIEPYTLYMIKYILSIRNIYNNYIQKNLEDCSWELYIRFIKECLNDG